MSFGHASVKKQQDRQIKSIAHTFAMKSLKKPLEDDLELMKREEDFQEELIEKISGLKQEGKAIF